MRTLFILLLATVLAFGQDTRPAEPAVIKIKLPRLALVVIDDNHLAPLDQDERVLTTPPLKHGLLYRYTVTVTWVDGVVRKRQQYLLKFVAGETLRLVVE